MAKSTARKDTGTARGRERSIWTAARGWASNQKSECLSSYLVFKSAINSKYSSKQRVLIVSDYMSITVCQIYRGFIKSAFKPCVRWLLLWKHVLCKQIFCTAEQTPVALSPYSLNKDFHSKPWDTSCFITPCFCPGHKHTGPPPTQTRPSLHRSSEARRSAHAVERLCMLPRRWRALERWEQYARITIFNPFNVTVSLHLIFHTSSDSK